MKLEEFASVVLDSDILTKDEVFSVIKRLSSVSSFPVGFPETKRSALQFEGDIQRCLRYDSWSNHSNTTWYYSGTDAIKVSVNQDVVLHGLCLFGSKNTTYVVELNVMDPCTESICVSKTGQFTPELLQRKHYCYPGYRVSFDKNIILKKNKMYDIRAKISGPPSQCGFAIVNNVQCSGVTFTFIKYPNGGMNIIGGQFPELLFSV